MPEPENEPKPITMGDIRDMVTDMVAKATAIAKGGDAGSGGESGERKTSRESGVEIQSQVQAELKRLREMEERQQSDAELRATVTRLAAKADEKPEEKSPIERKRVHRFMKWGEN